MLESTPAAGQAQLTLLRHGESLWNLEQRFTGWADVDLTREGIAQMRGAAIALREAKLEFDVAFTSVLKRCIRSQWVVLDTLDCMWLPQVFDWRLNERHYGALTGRLKAEAVQVHREAAVKRWRRSYDAQPPAMDAAAAAWVPIDRRYAALQAGQIPASESLRQTVERVQSAWSDSIAPALKAGQRVLVTGHGNGLRALIKILEGVSDNAIVSVEVPNAAPIVYALDGKLQVLHKRTLPVPDRNASEIL
jgi:2,3-bisphosphoglycerate-dependent phosphoglycerate mutase